jgi:hypothetical protein
VQNISGPPSWLSDTNVIVPGRVSDSTTSVAAAGPALPSPMEYTTSPLGAAAAGPTLETCMSAGLANVTCVCAIAVSLSESGSGVAASTVAVLVSVVPAGVPGSICTVTVKLALAAGAKAATEQVIVPLPPTAGVMQKSNGGPEFCESETKLVPAGTGSASTTPVAPMGPRLTTVIV